MNEAAKKYLRMCKCEDTHPAGPGEHGGRYGLVHEDGSPCDARRPENCPEDITAEKSDADLTKEAYAKARRASALGRHMPTGSQLALGVTSKMENTQHKNQALHDAIIATGMNVNQFAKAYGLNSTEVYGLLSGSQLPITQLPRYTHNVQGYKIDAPRAGEWTWNAAAQRVAAALETDPWKLFPKYRKLVKHVSPDEVPSYGNQVERKDIKEQIRKVLGTLTDQERAVVIQRYGLDGKGSRTLAEAGEKFGVTTERIRQIEAKALRKLRCPPRLHVMYEMRRSANR